MDSGDVYIKIMVRLHDRLHKLGKKKGKKYLNVNSKNLIILCRASW